MVTSGFGSFLLTGLPHRQGEVADASTRLPTKDGIGPKRRQMVDGKQDTAPRIYLESSHRSGDRTGQAKLAGRIQKQKNAFADSIALATRPQANPLRDGDIFSRSRAANRSIDMKLNFHGLHCRAAGRRPALHALHRAREDQSGSAGNSRKTHWQPGRRTWSDGRRYRYVLRRELLTVEIKRRVRGQGSGMNRGRLANQSWMGQDEQRKREQTENSSPVQGNDLSQPSARRATGKRISVFPGQGGSQ